jgi:hypothetical protein
MARRDEEEIAGQRAVERLAEQFEFIFQTQVSQESTYLLYTWREMMLFTVRALATGSC